MGERERERGRERGRGGERVGGEREGEREKGERERERKGGRERELYYLHGAVLSVLFTHSHRAEWGYTKALAWTPGPDADAVSVSVSMHVALTVCGSRRLCRKEAD